MVAFIAVISSEVSDSFFRVRRGRGFFMAFDAPTHTHGSGLFGGGHGLD